MATAKKAPAKKKPPAKTVAAAKKLVAKKSVVEDVATKAGPPRKTPTRRGRAQDRRLVAGKQKHEVRYEAKKEGVSPGIVQEIVKAVGNARKKVETAIEEFTTKRKPPARKSAK